MCLQNKKFPYADKLPNYFFLIKKFTFGFSASFTYNIAYLHNFDLHYFIVKAK